MCPSSDQSLYLQKTYSLYSSLAQLIFKADKVSLDDTHARAFLCLLSFTMHVCLLT